MVSTGVGKAKGAVVLVFWARGKNASPDKAALTRAGDYTVHVYFRPIATPGQAACDDVVEAIEDALHNWNAQDGPGSHMRRMQWVDTALVPDTQYIIYEISLATERV